MVLLFNVLITVGVLLGLGSPVLALLRLLGDIGQYFREPTDEWVDWAVDRFFTTIKGCVMLSLPFLMLALAVRLLSAVWATP